MSDKISYITFSFMWFISFVGFCINLFQLMKCLKDEDEVSNKTLLYEIRTDTQLILMWISIIGINLLD